jgi:hypothetical protein
MILQQYEWNCSGASNLPNEVLYQNAKFGSNMCTGVDMYKEQTQTSSVKRTTLKVEAGHYLNCLKCK